MTRWLLLLVLLAGPALAQEPVGNQPFVDVSVSAESVAVGEELRLQIVVLAPTWFPKAPVFPSFELANTITRLPPDASRSTSRRIGRDNWSGVQRNYAIYPLIGARFQLDGLSVKVTYADPDNSFQPVTVEVPIPPIEFSATVPAGAEGLDPYVAGTNFSIEREIDGETDNLETGDALVVRYIAELEGLPAMFIPQLVAIENVPGVSVYPESPRVEEGDVARRTEKLTYVFANGGEYTAPAISIDWWNTSTGAVETATIDALTVSVTGEALEAVEEEPEATQIPWREILRLMVILGLVYWVARRYGPGIRRWLAHREAQRLASESHSFDKLSRALSSGDARAVPPALATWLNRLAPGMDARGFARAWGGDLLINELEALSGSLYDGSESRPDFGRLKQGLETARKRYLDQSRAGGEAVLPPLNP